MRQALPSTATQAQSGRGLPQRRERLVRCFCRALVPNYAPAAAQPGRYGRQRHEQVPLRQMISFAQGLPWLLGRLSGNLRVLLQTLAMHRVGSYFPAGQIRDRG